MTGKRMDFHLSAHLSADTEITVKRDVGWVLSLGSSRWDSPSGGKITLFGAAVDLRRVAEAITAALAAEEGDHRPGCEACRELGPLLTAPPGTSGRTWVCECGTTWTPPSGFVVDREES